MNEGVTIIQQARQGLDGRLLPLSTLESQASLYMN
jgi:hypothetical protein